MRMLDFKQARFSLRTVALVLSVLVLVAAGCGGDDEETPDSAPTAPAPAAPNGSGSTVSVAADPGGALAYEPTTLTATAGTVTIDFANESQIPHDVVIEQEGKDVGSTEQITASTTETSVDLEAGTFTFYCSVPGHRAAGMKGTLTVK